MELVDDEEEEGWTLMDADKRMRRTGGGGCRWGDRVKATVGYTWHSGSRVATVISVEVADEVEVDHPC